MQQLALPFPTEPTDWAENFVEDESNLAAMALVQGWPAWPGPWAGLFGEPGVGKTHLARIWWQRSDALWLKLEDLEAAPIHNAVLDLEQAAGLPAELEEPLFHYLNNVRLAGCSLLVTSRPSPARWDVALADLASRLRSFLTIEVAAGDEAFLGLRFQATLAKAEIDLSAATLEFVLKRLPRSATAYRDFTDALQRTGGPTGQAAVRHLATQLGHSWELNEKSLESDF